MADSVSNLSTSSAMRSTVVRLQREMTEVRTEAATGKVADRGLALGVRSSLSVDLHEQVKRIESIRSMNANVASRLEATQDAMTSIRSIIDGVMSQFAQARSAGGDYALASKSAAAALEQLNDKLNASFNGQYLFAGVNTDVRPVAPNPHDPASAGRAAVDTSFLAQFGMIQSDPNLESIPAAAVDAWIDGSFSTLFEDSGWRTNFSGASPKVIQSRVSMSEVVASSVSSDSMAFRDVTRALSLVGKSGIDNMSRSAADRLMDRAMNILGSGQQAVTSMQADMGSVQTRVSDATERLTIQSQSLAKSIGSIEDVDPYEVSVRLNNLQTQIETSYALTSRISQLSLLKFL